jgi:hypothetical protein
MDARHLPAWCERRQDTGHDGRYVVACYFNRDGHPVSKARAEKVILTEYHPDGTPLLSNEALIEDGAGSREERMLVASSGRVAF